MTGSQQSMHEIDSSIAGSQQLLSALPRFHPLRPACACILAKERLYRYTLSNQKSDLDQTVLHLTESILLQTLSRPEFGSNIFLFFFNLASALYLRANKYKQPEDAAYSAQYLRHLRDRPLEVFGFPHHLLTLRLVDALAVQVELEVGNVMQKIGEMADLCRELLTSESDVSEGDTTRSVTLVFEAVLSKIRLSAPGQPLDQVIECLRTARMHKPELRGARYALAICFTARYCVAFVNDDYEEAVSVLDEIIDSSSPGNSQDEFLAEAQQLVIELMMIRSTMVRTPEHSEEAIHRARTSLTSLPVEQASLILARVFEHTSERRVDYFDSVDGPGASSRKSPLSRPVMSIEGCDNGNRKDSESLGGLLSRIHNNDTIDIEEAIAIGRTTFTSSDPQDHHPFPFLRFETFSQILYEGFRRTKKIEYIDESISISRQALKFPSAQLGNGSEALSSLAVSLVARFMSFPDHHTQDLDEAMKLFSQGTNHAPGSLPFRVRLASLWAGYARYTRHSSVSAAYEKALSLMQNVLLFAPTLPLQHTTLAKTSHDAHVMPLDYASYHIESGRLKEAIETLERGRALLWSEMRHLRASVDQLLKEDPDLGHKFAAVNRDLEELSKSIPPSLELSMDTSGAGDLKAADPFGHLLLEQRALLKERDNFISQIRALPGFDSFLTPPLFDTLRSAASSGPVIIINHSIWRSDILILLHDTTFALAPTPDDFFDRASALKDELLNARNKHGPNSDHYNHTLAHILAELYDLVGKPVIDRLRQLNVPEQSRVWWCPTSVFCSLPLHAMGPIPSYDGADDRYFLDLYIPSYTPTLSALIPEFWPSQARLINFRPSFITSCGTFRRAIAGRAIVRVESIISESATPPSALDGLQHHQFVHFACHGTLEARKPFDAGFELYGNERLTLLDIVGSRVPAAEFAFLAACHTAELTDGSSADESLHLAAAVQYCGFRSVVGTMWAMANEDGPDIAKHFYKSVFSRREQGKPVPYYQRSAGALRDAVKKLRRKRGITVERWVNFVHYGA
ncbi:CHAT domain-containing protein [Lactarius deliciosus]|nr:CHAT domain-containing protein [Lactarius deliciosus]